MIGSNEVEVFFVVCDDCDEEVTSTHSLEEALDLWGELAYYTDGTTTLCWTHAPRCPECGDIIDEFHEDPQVSIERAAERGGYCPDCYAAQDTLRS